MVTFGECSASLKLPRCTSLPCALAGILISSDFKGVCFCCDFDDFAYFVLKCATCFDVASLSVHEFMDSRHQE